MSEIIPDIRKTTNLIQNITASNIEQNSVAVQISQAIQQLSQITQENTSASEKFAASAEELSGQAQQLLDTISFFKTSEDEIQNYSYKELEKQIQQINHILEKRKGDCKRELFLVEKTTTDNKTDMEVYNEEEKTHGIKLKIDDEKNNDEVFGKY